MGDGILITCERDCVLVNFHSVVKLGIFEKARTASTVLLVPIDVGPHLRLYIQERPGDDAHNLAVSVECV